MGRGDQCRRTGEQAMFAITGLFKKTNEVEAGRLDEVDAARVPLH